MITDRGLTVAQRDSLESDGYLLVESLLDRAVVDALRARLAELVTAEVAAGRADYGNPGTVEAGVVHATLDPADPSLAPLHDRRLLAEAATAVLGRPWHVTGLGLRAPLRVIPGSHRVDRNPVDALPPGCEMGPHPDEVKIVAPTGSVVLFNGADLWHSGTFNYGTEPRLAVTAGFGPGDSPMPSRRPT